MFRVYMYVYIYLYKGDYTTQFCGDVSKPLQGSLFNSECFFVFDSQASSEWTVLLVWMFGEKIRGNFMKLHETSQVSGWWYEGNLAKAPVEIDQNNRNNGICDISTGDRILPQCVNDMEDNARRPSTSILSTEFMQDITWHKPDSTLFDCIT